MNCRVLAMAMTIGAVCSTLFSADGPGSSPAASDAANTAAGLDKPLAFFLLHQPEVFVDRPTVGASLRLRDDPAGVTARARFLDAAGVVRREQALGPIPERLWRPTLDLTGLVTGAYQVECSVIAADGKEIGRDAATLRILPAPVPARLIIPLRIEYAPRTTNGRFPVTVGVPFANGAFPAETASEGALLLNERKEPVPVQIRPLAFWGPDRRFVQWLQIAFLCDVRATGARMESGEPPAADGRLGYTLICDRPEALQQERGRAAAALAHPVTLSATGDVWVLDNGFLRLTLDARRGNPFQSIAFDPAGAGAHEARNEILAASDRAGFFWRDERHREYRPEGERPWTFRAEKTGPIDVCVRMDATLRDAEGAALADLVVRIQQSADLPRFQVTHTFVYKGSNETAQVTGLGLRLPFRPAALAAFGLDEYRTAATALPKDGPIRFLQSSWYNCFLEQGAAKTRKLLAFADFAPGWMTLDTPDYQVAITFPAGLFWKEYPKEFYVEPDGMTWIDLVPAHADYPLDLRTGLKNIYALKAATGMAKTHRFSLEFYRGAPRTNDYVLETAYGTPVALPDPDYLCATRVIPNLPRMDTGDVRAADWERRCREYMWYGILDYGDCCGAAGGAGRVWYFERTGRPDFMGTRYRMQHEQLGARWLGNNWLALLAGGNRLGLEKAAAITRHMLDVDTVHFAPGRPEWLGGHHNHGGSAQHWSGKVLPVGIESAPKLTPMLMCYVLTGYERAWDVVAEWREGLLARPDIRTNEYTTRRGLGPVEGAARLYKHTWDPRLLETAREHWNVAWWYHDTGARSLDQSTFWCYLDHIYYAAETYYDVTGDERIRRLVLERPPAGDRFSQAGDLMAWTFSGDVNVLNKYVPNPFPRLLRAGLKRYDIEEPPLVKTRRETFHEWMDPERDLYGRTLENLALEAVRAGRLGEFPSYRTITCVKHQIKRDALVLVIEKRAGVPFTLTNVEVLDGVAIPSWRVWQPDGTLLAEGPVSNACVTLAADLPAGLYRVRVAYAVDSRQRLKEGGGYTYLTVTLPVGVRWMIETCGTDGYPVPSPRGDYGYDPIFARFVVPDGVKELEILFTRDLQFASWVLLLNPAKEVAGMVKSEEKNWVRSPEFSIGLKLGPRPGVPVTPGLWMFALERLSNIPVEFQMAKGALPYMTFAEGAAFTAEELSGLPKTWEGEKAGEAAGKVTP